MFEKREKKELEIFSLFSHFPNKFSFVNNLSIEQNERRENYVK
jgi:hypothetical protein